MRAAVHDEHRQLAERHWWFRARRAIFDRVLADHVSLRPGARILDLGPGSGTNLPVLRPRGAVTVVDLDRGSLQACAAEGVTLLQADATSPPLAGGSVDLIAALDVLEHLGDDAAALAAWRDLLRPDGRLLLSVPALGWLWGRQDVLAGHHRRYHRPALRRLLERAGFEVLRLSYFNTLLLPPIAAVRLAMRPFLRRSVANGCSDLAMGRGPLDGMLYRLFACEAGWLSRHDLPLGVSLLCLARPAARGEDAGR